MSETGRPARVVGSAETPSSSGASQRVLYFGSSADDASVAVALSDLAEAPRLLVEMATDLDDLQRRLMHKSPHMQPVTAIIVAGSRALDALLPILKKLWDAHKDLDIIAFHDELDTSLAVYGDERLILIDSAADTNERRRILGLALRNTQLLSSLALARTERTRSGQRQAARTRPHGGMPASLPPELSRDPLTGLADRSALHQRLEAESAQVQADSSYRFALLLLNVNRFKVINDSFGHDYADALLVDIAQRLADAVRQTDLVARMSADEFAIVLSETGGPLNAHVVAQRLVRAPVTLTAPDGRSLPVTAAIGGVIVTSEMAHSASDVLRKASLALATVKARGGAYVEFFHPEAHGRSLFELDLEPQILRGIRNHEFSLHHQPVVSLRDGRIEGFEALLRWHHPVLGLVSPGAFMPMLETSGLIEPLGEWIATRACADLLAFDSASPDERVFVNLNVSHRQLRQAGFAPRMLIEVQRSGVDPRRLGIELTETTVIDNLEAVTGNIKMLRAAGLKVFVDDFGVGYSSLSSLTTLPVDVLKIDRSFIANMVKDERALKLVRKIVEIGHVFDLPIIAEGIETVQELAAAQSVGCDLGQGYHFTRAVPRELAMHLLSTSPVYSMPSLATAEVTPLKY